MNYFATASSMGTSGKWMSSPMISPTDFSRFVNEGLLRPVLQGLSTAATNFSDSISALSTSIARSTGVRLKDCGCERVDPCHCRCCVTDADLTITVRLGETRVVPLSIENKWRRERSIKLELSEWTRRGGAKGPVTAELLPPAPEFKLAPCGQQTIVMIVRAGDILGEREHPPDVDDCTVYYADLRVTGCDIRPIRIAVALLPRDCEAYCIECTCGCC